MMEGIVFLEAGAWKSIEELEDILILEELSYLYNQAVKKEQRLMKAVAMAFGAEIPDDDDEQYSYSGRTYDSEMGGYIPNTIVGNNDASMLPISIGYESSL